MKLIGKFGVLLLLLSLTHSVVYKDYVIETINGKKVARKDVTSDITIYFEGVGDGRPMTIFVNVNDPEVTETYILENIKKVDFRTGKGNSVLIANDDSGVILSATKEEDEVKKAIRDFEGLIKGEEWVYKENEQGYRTIEIKYIDLTKLGFTSKRIISGHNSQDLGGISVKIEFNSSGAFLKVGDENLQKITGIEWTTSTVSKKVILALTTAGAQLFATHLDYHKNILDDRIEEYWGTKKVSSTVDSRKKKNKFKKLY
jgi:hypothetical protein